MTVSHMLDLLNEMRGRKPAMYVGRTSLSKLADFLRGYDYAIYRLLPAEADEFLADFRDWIQQSFGTTKKNWEDIIRLHSGTDNEAVDRFWVLLDKFLLESQNQGNVAQANPFPTLPTNHLEDRSKP
jgi:hypothetical protein